MNIFTRGLRQVYSVLFHPNREYFISPRELSVTGQAASDRIKQLLEEPDRPVMISRLGLTECKCLLEYTNQPSLKSNLRLVRGQIDHIGWTEEAQNNTYTFSGFFPTDQENIKKFCRLFLKDMTAIDLLGSWIRQEALFDKELKNAVKVPLSDLEPFFVPAPWTTALRGKKVLVIHPFETSIRHQYQQRELLFENPDILPLFELKTVKAVQTIANNESPFATWFEALDYMKQQIDRQEYDIAIIGAGAYGLPLAAHIKRQGKKAIHLGGAVQLLFGIKGKRWEERDNFKNLFNEHWIRPLPEDYPENFKKVEDGCYW